MSFELELENYVNRFWAERSALLKETEAWKAVEETLSACSEEERLYFQYVLSTVPVSDLGDTPPILFLNCVRHALFCRRTFSWCAALPPQTFLLWALFPRINNEELSDCRGVFYDELAPRVSGLPLSEAILEVNRFCAEYVTYRSTDDRTASALAVYQCGYGRCGEESVFAVNALRSVGIAARQVYAPWWSHCDDNHAWVEVWDGEGWRYLGACEPEPVLDRGWFTGAASRAMMIHTRAFVSGKKEDVSFLFPETDPIDLTIEHGVAFEAVTHRYAQTALLTVKVQDEKGAPVSGTRVACSVLNMAAFRELCAGTTDKTGTARFRLGKGSVLVSASLDGAWGEQLLNSETEAHATLTLAARQTEQTRAFEFVPPQAAPTLPAPLPPHLQEIRRRWLEQSAAKRVERNKPEEPLFPHRQELIRSALSEKDRAVQIPQEVLEDAALAFQYEGAVSKEDFLKELLPHRISLEPLRPWRKELSAVKGAGGTPERIRQWVEQEIALIDGYPAITPTPTGVLRVRHSTRAGREVFFRALCRAKGLIPHAGHIPAGCLRLEQAGETIPVPNENCSCSKLEQGRFVPVPIKLGENLLPAGFYRFLSVARLPNGKQLAELEDFTLSAGGERKLAPHFRQGQPDEMLACRPLPPFTLHSLDGEAFESARLFAESKQSLLIWLEVGREPTEHVLNELAETELPCALQFVIEAKTQQNDPTLQKAMKALPNAKLWLGNFGEDAAALARQMFGDPDKLPLVLLSDSKGNGLYSSSGYNVGTAKLLLSLLKAL